MMTPEERAGFALLRQAVPPRSLVVVALLSLAGSLTEGLGLMLLVPMLGLIGAPGGGAGAATGWVAWLWEQLASAGLPGLLALFVALVALRAALVQWRIHVEEALQLRVAGNLRQTVLDQLFHARWSWLAEGGQARIITTLMATVEWVASGLQQVQMICAAGVTLAVMFAAVLLIDPLPAIALAVGGLVVALLHLALRGSARRGGVALDRSHVAMFGFYAERLANLRLVKSFGAERRDLATAADLHEDLRQARLAFSAARGLGQFALQAGTAVVVALTVWLAVAHWSSSPATLLPLIAVSARAAPLLAALQAGFQNLAHALPSLAELGRTVECAAAAAEPMGDPGPAPRLRGSIALRGATVAYAGRDRPALDGVTVELPAGSTILLTGPSGAGKSTLADVCAGLLLPDAGVLEIDGQPLTAALCRAWRGQVAYVQQEPVLFHASIRENLRWAMPEASDERLEEALRAAAAQFVFALPEGLDTVVGDRGAQLSGGERQRIALARGLLRRPDLLILDEVTSALDAANEAAVREAVAGLKGRMTIVIIGHRGALAELADRRLTLEAGRIVGDVTGIVSQMVAGGTRHAMKG